jgi:signal transduction histidine kinase
MRYSDIFASVVHDIKNSMSVISNHIDDIQMIDGLSEDMRVRANVMHQEMRRANNQLVQILTLYKMDNQKLRPNIMEHNVYDFLEELMIEENALAEAQNIDIQIECDEWLSWYFDLDLIRGVLSSTIGNAKRYTEDRVQLSAEEQDGYLVLRVEDNGAGLPQSFIDFHHGGGEQEEDVGRAFSEGRTQLGFFFATTIATAHVNRDRKGFIILKNGHELPGGCFELWLP